MRGEERSARSIGAPEGRGGAALDLGPPPLRDFQDPPEALAPLTDWFEALSYGLVLLEPYPLVEVAHAIDRYERATDRHVRSATIGAVLPDHRMERLAVILRADHAWFQVSFEQLRWFYAIVAHEDHGGHRQALGQYGRLLTEAMRRHLADEGVLAATCAKG
ncbi:MAG: hypothetical protein ACREBZ_04910 [Thermoplasmata archaeon]